MAIERGIQDTNLDLDVQDKRPGSSDASAAYTDIYDPRNEQKFSNLTEAPNQVEQLILDSETARLEQEANAAIAEARSKVHFWPSVGKFIIPKENTWSAHAALVKNDENALGFSPDKYIFFDKIIAQKTGDWIMKPEYAALRTNLEVLRNDTIGIYLKDGAFNPGDEVYVPYITGVAAAIGDMLANGHAPWWKRPFVRGFDIDVANVEGVGAQEIYKRLLSMQERRGEAGQWAGWLKSFLGIPSKAWELPPIEETPYSEANMSAPPPHHGPRLTESQKIAMCSSPHMQQALDAASQPDRLVDISQLMLANARGNATADPDPATKTASVDEAGKILRWLKNLQCGDKDIAQWLDAGTPVEQGAKIELLGRLTSIYASLGIRSQDGAMAIGALALAVTDYTLDKLPDNDPRIAALEQKLEPLPAEWDMRQSQSAARILDAIENALERATGSQVGRQSPAERLVEMSNKITATARKLKSIDTLEQPAREESIELAREILRRLKNLSFTDTTLKEMIDTGSINDKLTLARQFEEMADIYKNLLFEAAQTNPDIMQDARIKEAGDAISQFAHGIKLMAAKEAPGSIAATQQISSAQTAEDLKHLDPRTMERLLANMEGGLQKTTQALEAQQQQEQDKLEEQGREAAEAEQGHSHRRKRRSSSSRSGAGGARQRKVSSDIHADDRAAGQGRFAAEKQQASAPRAPVPGMSTEDLATIKSLGGSLHKAGKQAKNAMVADVKSGDKIRPDNQTLGGRQREREQQIQQNNKGIV